MQCKPNPQANENPIVAHTFLTISDSQSEFQML